MATLDFTACGATIVPANKRHARELGRIMRPKDREEAKAGGGLEPEAAVRMSINASLEAYAFHADGDLLGVFGVGPMPQIPDVHVLWAMTSVHVDKHRVTFWKCSKVAVNYFRDHYPLLLNMVHGKYTESLRWLERMGFQITQPEHFGNSGALFCKAILYTPKIEVARV